MHLPLVLNLTEPVITTIRGHRPLGIEFCSNKDGPTLCVAKVNFGCIRAWNLKYPEQAVVANDHLIQVDQKKSGADMEKALGDTDSWELVFRRYSRLVSD